MTQQPLQDKPDSSRIKAPSEDRKKTGKKVPKKVTATYLHNSGLYYLQRFAASTTQFRRIMQRKIDNSCRAHPEQNPDECKELLDALIETFQRSGLLNDELYAAGAIRSLRQRGLSTRVITAKMEMKGISAALVQATLAEIDSRTAGDPNMVAAIKHARRRHIGPFMSPDKNMDDKDRNKQLAAMARAGFDFETARKVLGMKKEEAESLIGSSGW